ncbi:carboxypeptidase-like regulatory domain-containing protein [Halomarina salina]|uniref:Carboxypeptidase-like regulatory domain-containing protein n=1 Tax=Halomarina salina TaxID=1872699 RepID=A0ABD5RL99_9EURY|nr:carboxypeptidase-like regulatory domain-containing protein [Halomarina salina]
MHRKYVSFVALLVLVSACAPTALAAQQQVTLTVTVVDQSGDSVGGANLTASWDGGAVTETTRANGQALIDVPEGASVAIDVEDDEYVRNVPKMVASAEGGAVTVDVAKEGSATVRVESAEGEALSDARVAISRDGTTVAHGTTNDKGGFYAETLERGDYDLKVVKSGYYSVERSLSVSSSYSFQTVSVEKGAVTARFRVVDDHFDEARTLAGATVKVGSLGQFNTSEDGTFSIGVPVNAEFEVGISKGGYGTTTQTVRIGESDDTMTLTVNRTPALTVSPTNTQVVVGQTVLVDVTDEYGDVVADATLRADGETVGTTNDQGSVRFSIDGAGEHDVTAVKAGVSSEAVVVEGVSSQQAAEGTPTTTEPTTADETVTSTTTEPTASDGVITTADSSGGSGPGFTGLLALLALVTTLGFLARRR